MTIYNFSKIKQESGCFPIKVLSMLRSSLLHEKTLSDEKNPSSVPRFLVTFLHKRYKENFLRETRLRPLGDARENASKYMEERARARNFDANYIK